MSIGEPGLGDSLERGFPGAAGVHRTGPDGS